MTYNGRTLSYYDATQQQRYIERQIRRWKREYRMMDAAGQDTEKSSMKLAQWRATERDFCKQTGIDRDGFRSQVEGFGRSEASKATWEAKKNFQAISLSDDLDYMASFVPEFEEIQKVKAVETDLQIKKVKNSRFSLWVESSLGRKNGAISIMERYMRQIQPTLPEDFEIPKMAVIDFDKHKWDPKAIAGYDRISGILFFNSKYDTEAKILKFLQENKGEFANTTVLSPFLHELGHKYHYDLIQKLAKLQNLSYNKVEIFIEGNIMGYSKSFIEKQISGKSCLNFHELMAEWFASSKKSDLGRFISEFVKGLIV